MKIPPFQDSNPTEPGPRVTRAGAAETQLHGGSRSRGRVPALDPERRCQRPQDAQGPQDSLHRRRGWSRLCFQAPPGHESRPWRLRGGNLPLGGETATLCVTDREVNHKRVATEATEECAWL